MMRTRQFSAQAGPAETLVTAMLLAMLIVNPVHSEETIESLAEREQQLFELIEHEEQRNGRNAKELIGPLTELSVFYEESNDYGSVYTVVDRLQQVIRINFGLYALELAPSTRLLISLELARGNAAAAWDLEQRLLGVAERHRDDLRTVRILHDTADRRMDVLSRYDTGEFPEEIILGCYYKEAQTYAGFWLGNAGSIAPFMRGSNSNQCSSGSRSTVRQSLLAEARSFYSEAVNIILRNELYSSDELRDLLMKLVDSSYRYGNPALGRRSLQYLLAYQNTNADEWLPRIEALVQLADWDLLHSNSGKQNDAALALYEEARDLLAAHAVDTDAVTNIFSPQVPVVLPAFVGNPLVSAQSPASTGFIDVSFSVGADGRSGDIEVMAESGGATRAARKELVQLIRRSRFRPMVTENRIVDSAPIVVRYYLSE